MWALELFPKLESVGGDVDVRKGRQVEVTHYQERPLEGVMVSCYLRRERTRRIHRAVRCASSVHKAVFPVDGLYAGALVFMLYVATLCLHRAARPFHRSRVPDTIG